MPALSESEKDKLARTLACLPTPSGAARRCTHLIPLLALLMLLFSALSYAAAREPILNWLLGFGASNDALDSLVQPLDISMRMNDCVITMTNAVCDGRQLALSYSVENTHPEEPVYVSVRSIQVDGQDELRLDPDTADSEALPVPFTSFQDPDSDEPTTENPVSRGVMVTLLQPIEGESVPVSITFALLRAVTDDDEPELEEWGTVSTHFAVRISDTSLDLAPNTAIRLADCDAVFTRFILSPLSTTLDLNLIPFENMRDAAETLAQTYGDIALCDTDGTPLDVLDMDWLSSDSPDVRQIDGQWLCAYRLDMPGLVSLPDILCIRVEETGDAAKLFNEKMTFPTN